MTTLGRAASGEGEVAGVQGAEGLFALGGLRGGGEAEGAHVANMVPAPPVRPTLRRNARRLVPGPF